MLADVAKMRMS